MGNKNDKVNDKVNDKINAAAILSICEVSKSYLKKKALDNVSFDLYKGQIVGLLGPNGSGKTTLIKIINTLITDYTGEVLVCGNKPGVQTKKFVSYLPDVEFLRADMKIKTAIGMYGDFFGDFDKMKANEMIKIVKLEESMRINSLSKGMREKLQLVLTMARRAKLYIFDEPIAGVDPAARDFILETIIKNYNEEGAILFSTHLISDVEPILNRAIFIKEGQVIIDGDVNALREERKSSIDQIFREEFRF